MKKYFSASFMVECVIPENAEKPDYILRDQRGNICCRGDIQDIVEFFDSSFAQFKSQQATGSELTD